MREKLKKLWINSFIYRGIDRMISARFRRKLKNNRFTILCPNCVGGCIYHRLGKEFLSPRINLLINMHELIPFCLNLDWYLAQKIEFVKSELPYPIGILAGNAEKNLPDVRIEFNHDRLEHEAAEKWERRKKRINRDNLYLIMYRWSGITAEELHLLDSFPCKNKVLLSKFTTPIVPWEYYIDPGRRMDNYLERNAFGVRLIETKFDFVGFLNEGAQI